MYINVFYNDEKTDADIINVPDNFVQDLENVQQQFFKWLFDKNNNHNYWVIINGEKKYCSYDINAFIDWVNTTYSFNSNEKILLIEKNAKNIDFMLHSITF